MKLQELINQTSLDMNEAHLKAFFLGVLCAEKPMPFAKIMEELFSEAPEDRELLEAELKNLWETTKKQIKNELTNLFPANDNIKEYLELTKEQLDYFLTAMSLSGTNTESCDDEELAEFIEEIEDAVADLDEYVSEQKPDPVAGEELKEFLTETWQEFISTKN